MKPARIEKSLRVIGGTHRGRKFTYLVDPRTRPMKDRTREAVFNILGDRVVGTHVLDLFAGTGAMAIEALSRGAATALASERHAGTASLIAENLRSLGLEDRGLVRSVDALRLGPRLLAELSTPRLVIICPPYALYDREPEGMATFLAELAEASPAGTVWIVETDRDLAPPEDDGPRRGVRRPGQGVPDETASDPLRALFRDGPLSAAAGWAWRWRAYSPAVLGVGERLS